MRFLLLSFPAPPPCSVAHPAAVIVSQGEIYRLLPAHHDLVAVRIEREAGLYDDFSLVLVMRANLQSAQHPPAQPEAIYHPAFFIEISFARP